MLAEPRPRQLGRISEQAREFLATASDTQVDEVAWIFDCFESGERDCWDRIPQVDLPHVGQFGRVAALLTNGDVLIWRPYVDYPSLYAVFYIGPGSHFV